MTLRGARQDARTRVLTTDEFVQQRAPIGRGPLHQLAVVATAALLLGLLVVDASTGPATDLVAWEIVLLALLFETLDGSVGMGFGTALAPLLFLLGHPPLTVVPTLLVAQAVGGILAGSLHHEHANARFSLARPLNDSTRTVLVVAGAGVVATFAAILLGYLAFAIPETVVQRYVAVLVIVMAGVALAQATGVASRGDRATPDRRLLGVFATVAGVNKGLSGGGYGPVMVLGLLFSGFRERRAAAIVVMAEGLVALVGAATYLIMSVSVPLDLRLLPSVLVGSISGAILAPVLVRVLPLRLLRVAIPIYALTIGTFLLLRI